MIQAYFQVISIRIQPIFTNAANAVISEKINTVDSGAGIEPRIPRFFHYNCIFLNATYFSPSGFCGKLGIGVESIVG